MSIFEKLFGKSKKKKENLQATNQKPDFKNFSELLNQHAGLSFEKQQNFSQLTGGLDWNINLNRGMLMFGKYTFPIEVIGSLSFNDYSWMWGWANSKSGIPENLLNNSLKLKEIGIQKQIEEFTKGHFSVEEGFEHKMGIVAVGLLNADAYFCANYGQGTMVLTVSSDIIPKVDKNSIGKILTVFPQLIGGIELNHKEAFQNYLIDRDCIIKQENNQIEGSRNGKSLVAKFDELSRLKSINGQF